MRGGTQCVQYRFKHTISITESIIVPEPQNAIALLFKKCRAPRISFHLFTVLTTIQLNNEHRIRTNKISNERTDWNLTTEFAITERTIAQTKPQTTFSIRLIDTKITGSRNVRALRHEEPLTQPSPQRGED